jgi:dTDP-glucose 4,6-dehydratase
LRAELGWQDNFNLDQGLDECVAWVRTNFEALKAQPYDYFHKA